MTPITRRTPLHDLPELLTAGEAAAKLGISEGSVYALAKSGQIASVRLGRLLRIKRDGLRLLVEVEAAAK